MSKKKEKGDKYEAFTKEVLLLKQLTWSYDESNENISFDVVSNENIIYGISGAHHQIDVHLTSSVNRAFICYVNVKHIIRLLRKLMRVPL